MNEKTLKALIEAGAVKKIHLIANGALFHLEAITSTGKVKATTNRGGLKTWKTLDAAARWVHRLGLGRAELSIESWQPNQRPMRF